jgi:hypothetical protein
MAGITSAMCTSFKRDLLSGLHCFNQSRTFTGTVVSGQFTVTGVSSLTGIAVGRGASGASLASGAIIASIDSASQITLSKAHTGSGSPTITIVGDTFKIALFKVGVAGTYGAATTNYTDMTGNSDEVPNGSGYTTGGATLTNVDPTTSSTTAFIDFTPDPSWTSASFSTTGALIYNSTRNGPTATLATSVHDFGGTQTVSAGTFTAVMPTPDASNAILRLA